MRKTDIHQFTFLATREQADLLQKFGKTKGEAIYDAKVKIIEEIEETEFVKVHFKTKNCGPNLAAKRLAEFLLNATTNN
mgnify:CR=1 FL=1|jgi:hypothetical protein